jgi:hypothetical protein
LKIGNNQFGIDDTLVTWENLTSPDGLYDLKSFNKEFSGQLADKGINRHTIRFSLQDSTGKILIHFQKRGKSTFRLMLLQ